MNLGDEANAWALAHQMLDSLVDIARSLDQIASSLDTIAAKVTE
jgi:hypothetical protein